ncbi:hypothetical protein [Pedobacter gandavensis]|uniref:hypothetical protein n=1 Tax=Pedobacter gandavensis TaxID=2679963 RepID=UPI00292E28E1|nr:hypothetical protein [Pedobacter gandavensis]
MMKRLSELNLNELARRKLTITIALIAFGILGAAAALTLSIIKQNLFYLFL